MPNSHSSVNICEAIAAVTDTILFNELSEPHNQPLNDYLNCTIMVETFADADANTPETVSTGSFQIRVKTFGSNAWRTLEDLDGGNLNIRFCGGEAFGDVQDLNDIILQPSFTGRATDIRIVPIGIVGGNFYRVILLQDGV